MCKSLNNLEKYLPDYSFKDSRLSGDQLLDTLQLLTYLQPIISSMIKV